MSSQVIIIFERSKRKIIHVLLTFKRYLCWDSVRYVGFDGVDPTIGFDQLDLVNQFDNESMT